MKITQHENNESGTHCIVNTHFIFVRVSLNGDRGDITIALPLGPGAVTIYSAALRAHDQLSRRYHDQNSSLVLPTLCMKYYKRWVGDPLC